MRGQPIRLFGVGEAALSTRQRAHVGVDDVDGGHRPVSVRAGDYDPAVRALVQRVSSASVTVEGQCVAAIGRGLLVLLGVRRGDGQSEVDWIARKLLALRVFEDEEGRMNRSVEEVGGEVLCVSQFTLYGDARRGSRPSWGAAAAGEVAEPLVEQVVAALREQGLTVETGRFAAMMEVASVNDGPFTVLVEVPAASA